MAAGISSATRTASTASTGTSADQQEIAGNFQQFLTLLTTQLKNQNPLDPLDTNQFTQQLVQFASVEQQLRSNDTLNALLTSSRASNVSTAASFVGMEVTADGATSRLQNGKAEWSITPARDVAQGSITIRDKTGSVVATQTRPLSAGAQKFTWDGRTSTGTLASDGDYTITVQGRDATGQGVTVKTEIAGRVESVDMSGETPVLLVGSARVPLTGVKTIGQTSAQ